MLFLHVASVDLLPVVGVYGRWGFAEPNNRNGYQRCAALDKSVDLKFVDERCERTLGFVCDIRECYWLLSEKNMKRFGMTAEHLLQRATERPSLVINNK